MALFSQRKGLRPMEKAIQREAMDAELRNRLWSALKISIWDHWRATDRYGTQPQGGKEVERIVQLVWLHYFKEPVDTIPEFESIHSQSSYGVMRNRFFAAKWWQVYDFIEFIAKIAPDSWSAILKDMTNSFLEAENAAYRFVGDEIVEITDALEIESIETGLSVEVAGARDHLSRALQFLSDRTAPDYRNSVKESISSVEAMSQSLTGVPRATLGDGIKVLKGRGHIHPAFEQALLKLYGYTSDESGVRHALTEEGEKISFADAKFMLVACSGLVSYLITKAAELKLEWKE